MEKKHREKIRNTEKTQGKHREFYLGWNVATLTMYSVAHLETDSRIRHWIQRNKL